jgi:hypothetical protein
MAHPLTSERKLVSATVRGRLCGGVGRTDVLLVALSLAAVGCWLVLYRWYSIAGHYDHPYFAFEKVPGGFGSAILRSTLVLFVALSLVYATGYWLVRRTPVISRAGKLAIIGQATGVGLINVFIFPVGALDIFRYRIALKLAFFYHENPYVHGFMHHRDDPFGQHAFLTHLPNAKGPSWLLLSAIPSYLAGFDDAVRFIVALKAFNLALLGLTAWAIYRYVDDGPLPPVGGGRWEGDKRQGWLAVYLFLANPLVLFEGVGNGHNDVMIGLFLVAALLALRGRSWLTLPLVTLSALVKYFTFQLLPLFLIAMVVCRWRWRIIALSAAGALVVSVVTVAPFWEGGAMLQGIRRVEDAYVGSDHVSLVSLTQQYLAVQQTGPQVPAPRPIFAAIFAILALPVLRSAWRGRAVEAAAGDLLLLFLLLLTLLYPWYLIPVFALLVLRRDALDLGYLFAATALGLVYYPVAVWARFEAGFATTFATHLLLALFITLPILLYLGLKVARGAIRSRRG